MSYRIKTKPASMRVQKSKEVAERRTCGECARGEWNTKNRNWKKEVFFGYCEHAKFARTPDVRGVFLDNTPACDLFQAGAKRNGGVL